MTRLVDQDEVRDILQKWEEKGDFTSKDSPFSDDMVYLRIHGHDIQRLPPLPPNLEYLDCQHNELTELPELPPSLIQLHCRSNQLTKLPTLPENLQILFCENNQLTELPPLPNIWLLSCSHNPIKELQLPYSLRQLYCNHTYIDRLNVSSKHNLVNLKCSDIDIPYSLRLGYLGYICTKPELYNLPPVTEAFDSQNINQLVEKIHDAFRIKHAQDACHLLRDELLYRTAPQSQIIPTP